MAMPVKPTMSEMKIRAARLLGFGAMNTALNRIGPTIQEHLTMAQEELEESYRDELLRKLNTVEPGPTAAGQTLYDVPDDCDPQEVKRYRVEITDQEWRNLSQGIDTYQRSYMTPRGWPRRYDVRLGTSGQAQFEIWPEPDGVYQMELEYWIRPARFTEDTDRVTLDPRLVFLYAMTNLKAHYKQSDADAYSRRLQLLISALQGKQHGNRRYKRSLRNDKHDPWSTTRFDDASGTARVQLNDYYW